MAVFRLQRPDPNQSKPSYNTKPSEPGNFGASDRKRPMRPKQDSPSPPAVGGWGGAGGLAPPTPKPYPGGGAKPTIAPPSNSYGPGSFMKSNPFQQAAPAPSPTQMTQPTGSRLGGAASFGAPKPAPTQYTQPSQGGALAAAISQGTNQPPSDRKSILLQMLRG